MSIGIRTSLPCRSLRGFRCGKYGRSTTALTLPHAGSLAGLGSFDISLRGSAQRTRAFRHIALHTALRAKVARAPTALHLRPTHELFGREHLFHRLGFSQFCRTGFFAQSLGATKLFECRGIDLLRLLLGRCTGCGASAGFSGFVFCANAVVPVSRKRAVRAVIIFFILFLNLIEPQFNG